MGEWLSANDLLSVSNPASILATTYYFTNTIQSAAQLQSDVSCMSLCSDIVEYFGLNKINLQVSSLDLVQPLYSLVIAAIETVEQRDSG